MTAQIDRILFQAQGKPEGTLRLVQYKHGRVAILHDEQPINGCNWPLHQLYKGITAFRQIAAGASPTPTAA